MDSIQRIKEGAAGDRRHGHRPKPVTTLVRTLICAIVVCAVTAPAPAQQKVSKSSNSLGGSDVTADVALAATGGTWSTTTVVSGVTLKAGVQALRVSIAGAANAFDLDSIVVSGG